MILCQIIEDPSLSCEWGDSKTLYSFSDLFHRRPDIMHVMRHNERGKASHFQQLLYFYCMIYHIQSMCTTRTVVTSQPVLSMYSTFYNTNV